MVGERLLCMRNIHNKVVYNGTLWDAETVVRTGNVLNMTIKSEDGESRAEVNSHSHFFLGNKPMPDEKAVIGFDSFNLGYCLTVHKAQGSEWDEVLLYDEADVFREHAAKWLYTGITRAAKRIIVAGEKYRRVASVLD
jgi:exodeoxyribonuclease-5